VSPDPSAAEPTAPPHVEDTVRTIDRLHAEHHASASRLQKWIDRLTGLAGEPMFIVGISLAIVGWIMLNLVLARLGRAPLDPPPFSGLQGVVSLAALCTTLLILATQRRADRLASHREQLTLELSIIAERKTAKIIALIEELRRDHPELSNRIDPQAVEMSAPADAQAVLDAIAVARGDPPAEVGDV